MPCDGFKAITDCQGADSAGQAMGWLSPARANSYIDLIFGVEELNAEWLTSIVAILGAPLHFKLYDSFSHALFVLLGRCCAK